MTTRSTLPRGCLVATFVFFCLAGVPPGASGQDAQPDELSLTAITSLDVPLAVLTSVLGKGPDSQEVAALQKELNSDPTLSKVDDRSYQSWKGQGVSLLFEKEAVTAIFLYTEAADGFQAYRGKLPAGLKLSDDRAGVEKKLGGEGLSGAGGVIPYWASYPEKGLYITYRSKDTTDKSNAIAW